MRYLKGHRGFVQSVAFSHDGRRLVTGGSDGTWRLWDVLTGEPVQRARKQQSWVSAVAFSADGRWLATGGHSQRLYLYDAKNLRRAEEEFSIGSVVSGLAFSRDGKYLACSCYSGDTYRFEFRNHFWREDLRCDGRYGENITVAISPDSKILASAGNNEWIDLWNLATADRLDSIYHKDRHGCRRLRFSPDGKYLIGALGKSVKCWNVKTTRCVGTIRDHANIVSGLDISHDGRFLLTCSWDSTACLYEMEWGRWAKAKLLRSLSWGEGSKLFGVAFSPDVMLAAAVGASKNSVVVWDLD